MNKLKNVFQRSSQKMKVVEENRRPQQFVKRHSTTIPIATPNHESPPAIDLSDLSEMEQPAYQSWWKDLDPFDLQKINNQTILKFLNGCSLPDNKLEQILALFETAGDGLNKLQFFAMLRLIAHAQNGRKISRALVYLGAPIPLFHTNAIDALIKSNIPQHSPTTANDIKVEDTTNTHRKSWWGNEKEQLVDNNRRSYMGPFTAHTPIPNQFIDKTMMDYFYDLPPITTTTTTTTTNNNNNTIPAPYNTFSPNAIHQPWPPLKEMETPTLMRPVLTNALTTTATITPVTPNIIHKEEKYNTHSRSRSAGTASDFIHHSNPYQQPPVEDILSSSRSSLSLHELNTGQSLLLTQKFVYQSPSIRHQEINNKNNPFHITPNNNEEMMVSPFDDENSDDSDDIIEPNLNQKPNSLSIFPPPVPSQSNKPAFPKYTRTNTFLIKRSSSTAATVKHPSHTMSRHQRHKSTSATENIFY